MSNGKCGEVKVFQIISYFSNYAYSPPLWLSEVISYNCKYGNKVIPYGIMLSWGVSGQAMILVRP